MFKQKIISLVLLLSAFSIPPSFAQEEFKSKIFNAMQTEMERSLHKLKFEDFNPPYFIAYSLLDSFDLFFNVRYGSVLQDQAARNRNFYIEVRYGDYSLDNTGQGLQGMVESAPLEDDESAIKHFLWLATDRAYKQSVRNYLQKQGRRITEIEKEKISDLSKETPHQTIFPAVPPANFGIYRDTVRKTSEEFKKYKEILDSGIALTYHGRQRYYLNSEGTKCLTPGNGNPFFIYLYANTQAEDGMQLEVSRTFSVRSLEKLPSEQTLKETIESMTGELLKLREAKLTDPYTAPAILDSESAGVLFHEALGHRLEGERQRDQEEGQTFKGQIGKEVIPPFLTVEDDPTLEQWNGMDLNGFYKIDDEGVPAQKVVLVENGILRNYLLSRRPISGFQQSNGHGRAQFGRDAIGRMSNLIVKSDKGVSEKALKDMLLKECKKQRKSYGLMIRRTRSGDTYTGRAGYQAFRGTPEQVFLVDAKTGQEILVRGVEMVGTPLLTINKILATSQDSMVINAFCGAESGNVPVSAIAPSILVEEIELQRLREDKQRPPILPPPLFDIKNERRP